MKSVVKNILAFTFAILVFSGCKKTIVYETSVPELTMHSFVTESEVKRLLQKEIDASLVAVNPDLELGSLSLACKDTAAMRKKVSESLPSSISMQFMKRSGDSDSTAIYLLDNNVLISGSDIYEVSAQNFYYNSIYDKKIKLNHTVFNFGLNDIAKEKLSKISKQYLNQKIAICINNEIRSDLFFNNTVDNGRFEIHFYMKLSNDSWSVFKKEFGIN